VTAATGTANLWNQFEIQICNYATTLAFKTVNTYPNGNAPGGVGGAALDTAGGTWKATTAVTQVTILGQTTANLLTGSSLRVYGRL
jgi:hypothetical protein